MWLANQVATFNQCAHCLLHTMETFTIRIKMLTGQTAKLSTKNKLHYGYVYVIYKPRLLGVFDIYTTRV